MSLKNISTFTRVDEYAKAHQPPPHNPNECPYAGKFCYVGSQSKECTIADRVSCPDWNTPTIYGNCTFMRREEHFKQAGIIRGEKIE